MNAELLEAGREQVLTEQLKSLDGGRLPQQRAVSSCQTFEVSYRQCTCVELRWQQMYLPILMGRKNLGNQFQEGCVLVTTWYQIIVSVLPNCFSL